MLELGLIVGFAAASLYALVVGAWIASGATALRPGLGLALSLLGGGTATLAFDWFVRSREREALVAGTVEVVALAAAAACLAAGALLQSVALRARRP